MHRDEADASMLCLCGRACIAGDGRCLFCEEDETELGREYTEEEVATIRVQEEPVRGAGRTGRIMKSRWKWSAEDLLRLERAPEGDVLSRVNEALDIVYEDGEWQVKEMML